MLTIKTAVHRTDGTLVRAVLVTPSIQPRDIDNLTGEYAEASLEMTFTPPPHSGCHLDAVFWTMHGRTVPLRHRVGMPVPGYLLWDGRRAHAAFPRTFVRDYAVIDRYDPLVGDPVPCLTPLTHGGTLNRPRGEDRAPRREPAMHQDRP